MKKLLLVLAAAFAMVACQTDINEVGVAGGEVDVTFEVGTPTRAYSDGKTATVLQYAVYEGETELTALTRSVKGNNPDSINISKTVSFKLVTGNTYTVIFWAASPNAPYTVDFANKEMTVDYTAATTLSNDENRDAFFKKHTFTVKGAQTETIELRRPFAQLNIGTNDYDEATQAGYTPEYSAVTVKNIYSTLNLWDATVGGETEVDFGYAAIAKTETFPVDGYEYLAMNYLLVPADKHVVDIEFGYGESSTAAEKTRIVGSVPVQRNYRTNIYGQLLTSDVDINVEIKPEYKDEHNVKDGLFHAAAFGGEVTLTEDVVLEAPLKVQSNMVLNLNGKTITTTEQSTGRHHYAIDNYATLVIEGEGAIDARGIENFGTLIIDGNVTITNIDTNGGAAIWNEGKVTINDGTFKTNASAGVGSYGAALNTRANGEAIVNGGTFIANSQLTYAIINAGKTTIYNANVKGKHGAVAAETASATTEIYGGSFELMENPNTSDHCTYFVSAIYGGKFSLGNNTDCGGQVFYESTIANGYKSVDVNGVYHILPEVVADAATAANVTAVTESTADVATALATNNGEATMFMWNEVAYIAKYGEVVITSSAEEATTSRAVVESAAALTSATVAEGIEVVGNRTFRKCAELVTVALPNSLTEIGPAVFQSCSKLANVTIPASVTAIGEGAFAECVALTSINIPAGVTRLEKDVFRNTGLTSIEIPASVNYIGTFAFRDCESLTEVKILSPEFTIENNTFTNMAAPVPTMTIYVVNAEMKAYLESVLTNYDKSYITVVVM